jgi:Tol biopolymer transport system component
VWIERPLVYPCDLPVVGAAKSYPGDCFVPEAWALPIDGSPPHRVAEDLQLVLLDPSFSLDGARMAFSGLGSSLLDPSLNDWSVYVADADGTDRASIIRVDQDSNAGKGFHPIWSPRGDRIAYLWSLGTDGPWDYVYRPRAVDLRVVDLATGVTRSLAELDRSSQVFGWSPAGDALLFRRLDDNGGVSLWRVAITGGPPTVLVEGASAGAWQPTPVR